MKYLMTMVLLGLVSIIAAQNSLEDLRSPDIEVRLAAEKHFLKQGSPAIAILLPALEKDDPLLLQGTAKILGELQAKEALPALNKLLEHTNSAVRIAALWAILAMDHKAITEWNKILQDRDETVRLAAIVALNSYETSRVSPKDLLWVMEDNNPSIRYYAQKIMQKFDASLLPELQALLHEDSQLLIPALKALGQFKGKAKDSIPQIINLLGHSNIAVRHTASNTLVAIGKTAVPSLAVAVQHQNHYIRYGALKTIRKFAKDAQAAIPVLLDMLEQPDIEMQLLAAEALVDIARANSQAVLPQLQNRPQSHWHIWIMGFLPASQVANSVKQQLQSPDIRTQWSAIYALGRLLESSAVLELQKILQSDHPELRKIAQYSLDRISEEIHIDFDKTNNNLGKLLACAVPKNSNVQISARYDAKETKLPEQIAVHVSADIAKTAWTEEASRIQLHAKVSKIDESAFMGDIEVKITTDVVAFFQGQHRLAIPIRFNSLEEVYDAFRGQQIYPGTDVQATQNDNGDIKKITVVVPVVPQFTNKPTELVITKDYISLKGTLLVNDPYVITYQQIEEVNTFLLKVLQSDILLIPKELDQYIQQFLYWSNYIMGI